MSKESESTVTTGGMTRGDRIAGLILLADAIEREVHLNRERATRRTDG